MCIDAPESTTNSLSSDLIVDGAGRHQFSEGEKNVVLCFSFSLRIHLAIFHAASRAHRSCLPSLLETDPQILGIGVALMRIAWANYSRRWFLVSNVGVTQYGFGELNTSDWVPIWLRALP